MSKHRFSHIIALSGMALCAAMASCTDEFEAPQAGRKVSFEVAATGAWSRSASRAEAVDDVAVSTLTLSAGGQTLYLNPEIVSTADDAGSASRAQAVTVDNIADFGVYASIGDGAQRYYMENVSVTRANSWAPLKEYLWPGQGSLHINAYSPYCAAPDAASGITALPDGDPSTTPTIDYAVPADVADQVDLMWATPRDAAASPCALTFNHALAAVKFVAGNEMTPCTIKSITISGLAGQGTLDLESGAWSAVTGNEIYAADVNKDLAAASGSQYVAAGEEITDDAHTFMLMPQTFGDDATVSMVIASGESEIEFKASLSGQTWVSGKTYIYHLSANPAVDRFELTVDSPISFNYPGGSSTFSVKSIRRSEGGSETEIPWTAEFVDADGNVISTPSWITSMSMQGDGSGDYEASTQMVEPTFIVMSEQTRRLRQQPELGSEASPYNLSNSSGAPAVENTANCYVINAPGWYSIPLVYGNAIKGGADNTAAYAPTRTAAPFVNHLGNRIKHPYIYDNDGCGSPAGATLVWEGRLNMIHDLSLAPDGRSIVFEIPREYIRQGNAVVAVTDADGTIMWSWQLWITDYVPGDNMSTLSYNGTQFEIMPYNMGFVDGGDEVDFASSTALVRFTQHSPDGAQGQTLTVTVQQTGKHIITPTCYSFYQWGRKDPMISSIKEWYYADHTEITAIDSRPVSLSGGKIEDDFDALCVRNPQVFWVEGASDPTFKYTNNWNLGSTSRPVKTVYDPCPVGFMVPGNEMMAMRDMGSDRCTFVEPSSPTSAGGFKVICESGPDLFFPALGYRSGNSGNETVTTSTGGRLTALWTSHTNTREASALIFNYNNGSLDTPLRSDPRLEAFAVRAIRE